MDISEIGESSLLKRIQKIVSLCDSDVILGIGDDCAAFSVRDNSTLLFSSDMLVEGIHFTLSSVDPFKLGWKSVAVNLSDIAAMGGVPRYVLTSISCPSSLSVSFIENFYEGMSRVCAKYNTSIIGGDTVGSISFFSISVSVIGYASAKGIFTRGGAKTGDKIYMTGSTGDSSAGLELLNADVKSWDYSEFVMCRSPWTRLKKAENRLLLKHCMPVPRIDEVNQIINAFAVSSLIDLSDGLSAGIGHICSGSGKGALLYTDALPVSDDLRNMSKRLSKGVMDYVIYGGEDYELLFTSSDYGALEFLGQCPVTCIGEITDGEKGILLTDDRKKYYNMDQKGYEHFN